LALVVHHFVDMLCLQVSTHYSFSRRCATRVVACNVVHFRKKA
jgi:hypothetical protein